MTNPYEKALRAIIDRSHNGELGTSKVMDMRRIAEEALACGEDSQHSELNRLKSKVNELIDIRYNQEKTVFRDAGIHELCTVLDLIKKFTEGEQS